jgi:glutaminase
VHELVGDLGFVGVESLVRTVRADPESAGWRILDLARATRLDIAARTLLAGLAQHLSSEGTVVVLVEPRLLGPRESTRDLGTEVVRFADADSALEWCETQLLGELGHGEGLAEGLVPLAEQDLLRGLAPEVVAEVEQRSTTRVWPAGTIVFNEGDPADGVYFVGAGQVVADVRVRGQRGRKRLSSVAAGSAFGELALVDGLPRSTRIVALEPTICHVMSPEAFADLQATAPRAAAELSLAIARSLSQRLRNSTAEVAALEEA